MKSRWFYSLFSCIKILKMRYDKMNRQQVKRRVQPVEVMFSEYYYYLIAFRTDLEEKQPRYFRVDRIVQITEHRTSFVKEKWHLFNVVPYLWSGKSGRGR